MRADSPARLWVLLAREEHVGVVFRRGPSKQVMLIKWNTRNDSFDFGQWFKGRIYERRCDVSPNGELLIYFAAKQKPPLYSWTAISKPPFFTAHGAFFRFGLGSLSTSSSLSGSFDSEEPF